VDLRVDTGFATSRAQSMKSCATGASVRFFNVTIPTDPCVVARSMGKALTSVFPPGEPHCGFTRDGEEPPFGDKRDARDIRIGDHSCAGNIKSDRPKVIGIQGAERAVGRWQRR
jgi:hypothetical protein